MKKFHDDENVSESNFLIPDFEMSEDLDNIDQKLTRKRKIINGFLLNFTESTHKEFMCSC